MKLIDTLLQLFKTKIRNITANPNTLVQESNYTNRNYENIISEIMDSHPEIVLKITKATDNYICTVTDLKMLSQDSNPSELSQRQLECNLLNKEILIEFISRVRVENDIYISNSDERKTLLQSYAKVVQKIKMIDDYQRCEIVAGAYKDIHHLMTDYPAALFVMENTTDSGEKYFEFINPLKKTIQEPSLKYAQYISQHLPKSEIIMNTISKECKRTYKVKI